MSVIVWLVVDKMKAEQFLWEYFSLPLSVLSHQCHIFAIPVSALSHQYHILAIPVSALSHQCHILAIPVSALHPPITKSNLIFVADTVDK
jgi:hypothetical protein